MQDKKILKTKKNQYSEMSDYNNTPFSEWDI